MNIGTPDVCKRQDSNQSARSRGFGSVLFVHIITVVHEINEAVAESGIEWSDQLSLGQFSIM